MVLLNASAPGPEALGCSKVSDGSRDPMLRQQKVPPLMLCIGKDFLCLNSMEETALFISLLQKNRFMSLVMSVKRMKALTMPEPGSAGSSDAGGMCVLVCGQCHIPTVQRLNLSCRSLKTLQAQNSKVQTSQLVNTM